MCTSCGCGEDPSDGQVFHEQADGRGASVGAATDAAATVGASSRRRIVSIEEEILAKNQRYADANRRYLAEHGIFALNLVSSPGSGKTTLLVRTLEGLQARLPVAVIEGDQQTSRDAEIIRATGTPALQINTGKACHLDAHEIAHGLEQLPVAPGSVLFVENVGNLICPASFDLGEAHKVVILSVTEGEDKPLKYPDMFRAADLMIINKIDLLPHVRFDIETCVNYARRVKPDLRVLEISATRGDGLPAWFSWIEKGAQSCRDARAQGLRSRKAVLEKELAAVRAHLAREG